MPGKIVIFIGLHIWLLSQFPQTGKVPFADFLHPGNLHFVESALLPTLLGNSWGVLKAGTCLK